MMDHDAAPHDPPRARLTSSERRCTILEAAHAEFARVGFQGASTSGIAQRADCSEPMLYKHFANKQAIFVEALRSSIETYRERFVAAIEETTDVRERTLQFVTVQMHDPAFLELLHLRMLALSIASDPEVREMLLELERETHDQIRRFIERGIADGNVDPDTDPEYMAWGWLGLMLVSCYRDTLEPGTFVDMTRHVARFIESSAPRQ